MFRLVTPDWSLSKGKIMHGYGISDIILSSLNNFSSVEEENESFFKENTSFDIQNSLPFESAYQDKQPHGIDNPKDQLISWKATANKIHKLQQLLQRAIGWSLRQRIPASSLCKWIAISAVCASVLNLSREHPLIQNKLLIKAHAMGAAVVALLKVTHYTLTLLSSYHQKKPPVESKEPPVSPLENALQRRSHLQEQFVAQPEYISDSQIGLLNRLPPEIRHHMFSFLDSQALHAMEMTSKRYYVECSKQYETLFKLHLGIEIENSFPKQIVKVLRNALPLEKLISIPVISLPAERAIESRSPQGDDYYHCYQFGFPFSNQWWPFIDEIYPESKANYELYPTNWPFLKVTSQDNDDDRYLHFETPFIHFITPEMMGNHAFVRGVDPFGRPFLAIRMIAEYREEGQICRKEFTGTLHQIEQHGKGQWVFVFNGLWANNISFKIRSNKEKKEWLLCFSVVDEKDWFTPRLFGGHMAWLQKLLKGQTCGWFSLDKELPTNIDEGYAKLTLWSPQDAQLFSKLEKKQW